MTSDYDRVTVDDKARNDKFGTIYIKWLIKYTILDEKRKRRIGWIMANYITEFRKSHGSSRA